MEHLGELHFQVAINLYWIFKDISWSAIVLI